jgi:hypothetical protein
MDVVWTASNGKPYVRKRREHSAPNVQSVKYVTIIMGPSCSGMFGNLPRFESC